MKYIRTINWAFTYKCNLKCIHCDIWNNPYKNELNIDKIKSIISSDIVQESYNYYKEKFDIWISWWEPLLIENLKEIINEIEKKLHWSIGSISTNWILKDKLIDLLYFFQEKNINLKKINISIDGDENIHDLQRGIRWSFKKTIQTIIDIRKYFPKQIIEIKFTITKKNYKYIAYFTKLAYKLWIFFTFKPAENIINYTNQNWEIHEKFTEKEIIEIEKQIIWNPFIEKQNFYKSKYFFNNIPNYLKHWLGESKKNCNIANDSISIMPDWKVYSCILMNEIWNIFNNNIDKIWNSNNILEQRKKIKEWKCKWCMLMCWSAKTENLYIKKLNN